MDKREVFIQQQRDSGLSVKVTFVPQSESRNAKSSEPTLNWRVTLCKGSCAIMIDYQQGCAHIPGYKHKTARTVIGAGYLRETCETGRNYVRHRFGVGRVPTPEFADILECLLLDAQVLDYSCFEDWAYDFGYEIDSRSAEEAYKQCLGVALKLRKMVPLDAARAAFEE